jgi:epoxyqueuosine reductase QueG
VKAAADPAELTAAVRAEAARLGISRIGIAKNDPLYTFADSDAQQFETVIVCVQEQDWEMTQTAPSNRAEVGAFHGYVEGLNRSSALSEFLKARGYRTVAQGPAGDAIAIHYAVASGLGQLGLNGQLLTPQAGSRCRLLLLTTQAPLVCDEPVDHGLHGVCDECRACVRNCPVGAIPQARRPYRGVEKAKLNTERCLPIVLQVSGCAICMKVCPVQRYGLAAILEHRERTGEILGTGSDELEGYDWPLDGRHYGPGETPRVEREVLRPPNLLFDPQRREPPPGIRPTTFVGDIPS